MERTIELIPNYQHMFNAMLKDARTQGKAEAMFRDIILPKGDRQELLREVQRWFAPLTIAANCATTVPAIEELREAMSDMLAALDKEAGRLEMAAHGQDEDDPTDGRGLL